MTMTHRWAYNISLLLCSKESIDEDDVDIYTYGFEVLIDFVIETMLLFITGIVLKHLLETVVFICTFGVIRSFTGGYHASNKIICTIMTVLICGINIVCSCSCVVSNCTYVFEALGLFGALVICRHAPISHTNKQLDRKCEIRNRFYSRVICVVYVIEMLICGVYVVRIANVVAITLFQVSVLLLIGKGRARREEAA